MVERCHRDSGNASDAEFGKNAHDSVEPIFSSAGKDFLFSAQVPSGTPRVPRPNGCLRKAPRQAKDGREITKLTEKVKDRAIRDLYCLARASTLRKFPHCWASCKQTKLSDPDDAGVPSLSVRTPPANIAYRLTVFFFPAFGAVFLAVFLVAFFGAFFLAVFLVAFFGAFFLAVFLVAFFGAFFLAVFLVAFFAARFFLAGLLAVSSSSAAALANQVVVGFSK